MDEIDEITVLVEDLKGEENILPERRTEAFLRAALRDDRMVFEKDLTGRIVAFAVIQRLPNCIAQVEIGPIWSHRSRRREGLARKMIEAAIALKPGLSFFLVVTNESAIPIARACRFFKVQHLRWFMSCQAGCRLFAGRHDAPGQCRFRGTKDRHMFRLSDMQMGASGL